MTKQNSECAAALFKGQIIHQRFAPKKHGFKYPYHSIWLALDDLSSAQALQPAWFAKIQSKTFTKKLFNKLRLASYIRSNYLGDPNTDLANAVRGIADLKNSPKNRVFFLGQLEWFGFYFSPVNFYFIGDGKAFHTVLAEVNNTPWNESHCYIVPLNRNNTTLRRYTQEKSFQVSPFMASRQSYEWQIKYNAESIQISIKSRESEIMFIAAMDLKRTQINKYSMLKIFLLTPGLMFGSLLRIYLQALILFIKGVPFLGHLGDHGNQTKKNKEG